MSRTTYNKDKVEVEVVTEPVKMPRQPKAPSNNTNKKPRQYKDKQTQKDTQQSGEWTPVVKGKKPRT
jgi:hypothetical protein